MSFLREPGDLSTTPLAAILLEVWNLRLSGSLTVDQGGGASRLYFRDGVPVGAQVFVGFRPLGHFLLAKGIIDIDALDRCLVEMARARRPQGEILVEMGAIDQDTLDRVLAEQQAGYVALIAALQSGAYRFDARDPVPAWTRGIAIPPLRAIVDALAGPQAAALVAAAIAQAGDAVELGPGYADLAGSFGWTEAEAALAARMASPGAPETHLFGTTLPPERSRAVVAALVLLGLTSVGAGVVDLSDIAMEEAPAAPPEPRPVATPAPPAAVPAQPAPVPPPAPAPQAPTPPAAPPAAVSAAPPAPIPATTPAWTPAPTPAPVGRRSDPDEARARRQRLLARAMQNMGVGPLSSPPPSRPAASPVAAPGGRGGSGGPSGQGPDPADVAHRRALESVAPRSKEKELFARLGLPKGASVEEVKSAYHQIVKQFHPDKYAAPGLADLQPRLQEMLAALNEAYATLSDKVRRAEYQERTATSRASSKEDVEAARIDAQKAEACFRTRDYGKARLFFEAAIRVDPRPEYLAALAAVIIADPRAPDRARLKDLLAEATKDPACDRAHYLAGVVARQDGEEARAEKMFRAAVQANPRNADAARELKAVEGRRREAEAARASSKK